MKGGGEVRKEGRHVGGDKMIRAVNQGKGCQQPLPPRRDVGVEVPPVIGETWQLSPYWAAAGCRQGQ